MGMTLEEQLAHQLSEQVAEQIDNDLYIQVLASAGWTQIKHNLMHKSIDQMIAQIKWLENNCQGSFMRVGIYLMFEKQEDAVMCKLRWA